MATQRGEIAVQGALPRFSQSGARFLRAMQRKPLGAAGLIVMLLIALAAVAAPLLTPFDPVDTNIPTRLQGPGAAHFLGSDELGRDVWSRIVFGGRVTLFVAIGSVAIGSSVGLVLGLISGYFRGLIDTIIQRLVEVVLSFPTILLALTLMSVFGTGLDKVLYALTIVWIPRTARVMRGSTLSVRENTYVDAARALGASSTRIIAKHILPNIVAPLLIVSTALLGVSVLTEATLSFLGMGVPPPHPSWGRMLSTSAATYLQVAPWMVIFPGVAISLLVLSFNLLGDALRDIWDPKLRGR